MADNDDKASDDFKSNVVNLRKSKKSNLYNSLDLIGFENL